MFDLLMSVNFLAVLAAAAAMFVLSGLWYSKILFANAWMKENGFKEKDLTNPMPAMVKSVIAYLFLAWGMAALFLAMAGWGGQVGAVEGATWGVFLAVLIHGAAGFPNYAFENRSVKLFLIHTGNTAVGMAVMGVILALMG